MAADRGQDLRARHRRRGAVLRVCPHRFRHGDLRRRAHRTGPGDQRVEHRRPDPQAGHPDAGRHPGAVGRLGRRRRGGAGPCARHRLGGTGRRTVRRRHARDADGRRLRPDALSVRPRDRQLPGRQAHVCRHAAGGGVGGLGGASRRRRIRRPGHRPPHRSRSGTGVLLGGVRVRRGYQHPGARRHRLHLGAPCAPLPAPSPHRRPTVRESGLAPGTLRATAGRPAHDRRRGARRGTAVVGRPLAPGPRPRAVVTTGVRRRMGRSELGSHSGGAAG